jgi:hypothetical protein
MKQAKILLPFFLMFAVVSAMGQAQSKDSLRQANIRRLSLFLSLTPAQESAFRSIDERFERQMDSLRNSSALPQQKTSAMAAALSDDHRQLKQLFTEEQWKKFKAMLDERRAASLKAATEKHVTVRELPGQQ